MVRGKSKPILKEGNHVNQCPVSVSLSGRELWGLKRGVTTELRGLRMCSTYKCPDLNVGSEQLTCSAGSNSAASECREPQVRSPVNRAAFPPPSQGYCHREGCWTEKPRITMKWPPALRRGTHEEKNSDMETTQIPDHCRCHKTSNVVLDSCMAHRRDKRRASEQNSSRVPASLESGSRPPVLVDTPQ